jgi:hypothetical protein
MEIFKASTQYGDWKGSASADRSDANTLRDLLEQQGLLRAGEFLVGAKLWVGENHNNKLGRVIVTAYLIDGSHFDNVKQAIADAGDGLKLREVDVALTLEEFFSLFKRFEVSLSDPSFELEGRPFSVA